MSTTPRKLITAILAFTLLTLPGVGDAMELIYDFETDDQHSESSSAVNPPGWGSFGVLTLDRGANSNASAGETARFHAGDFDLPADLPGNYGIVDVSDRYNPYRKDFSGFSGISLDMKFESSDVLPYVGATDVQVGFGFIIPGLGEDESLQVYSDPFALTDTYETYEVFFDDFEFIQSGSTLENDLANNAFIKIRFLNTLENEGRGNLYYDEIYGLTDVVAGLPGDFNDNGAVDAADYTVWRDAAAGSGLVLANEVDTPGEATIEDYNTWSLNYGNSAPVGESIPEPAGLAFALGFVALNLPTSLRSRRRG